MKCLIALFVLVLVGIVKTAPDGQRASGCTDRYIWYADGSIECKNLYTESSWGLHKKPNYWCNDYSQTECCETCRQLRATPSSVTSDQDGIPQSPI